MIHVSPTHKVVGLAADQRLKNLFPQAKVVPFNGTPTILLPHGVEETTILRNLGYEVPAPILTQYKWPGSARPFLVQKLTAALFTTQQRCYCLNGMGTGKTKAALWSLDYLRGNKVAKRALVVAPLSTLDRVWRREAFMTVPHLSVGVLHGTKARRLKVLEEDHDIYVINTDGLKVLSRELMEREDIDTLILDELALFRNGGSERNKVARALATRMLWVWGLTGSPTPTDPTDAWGQCKIVTPHTVPKFFKRFRDELMVQVSPFQWVPKRDAIDKVFEVMQPAVRFTLDDVVELPPVVERTIDIELGKKQSDIYDKLRRHSHAAVQSKEITAVNAGALLNKLLQISMGYVYARDRGVVSLDNDVRLDVLVDEINSSEQKVIVFVPFTHALEGVVKRLEKEGIECAMVHGQTNKSQRDKIFGLFQDTSKYKVIAAHPVCMSHGLTLTAASTIIWFGPTTSLETFEQANARVRRVGQKHKQQVLMFQSTAVERKMYGRLRAKQQVQDNLLELFEDQSETERSKHG